MQIRIISIGKTDEKALQVLIDKYLNRLKHYTSIDWLEIPDIKNRKNLSHTLQKQKEGKLILKNLKPQDYLILLDEKGKQYTSKSFSKLIEDHIHFQRNDLVFVIGGPYGFSEEIYQNAKQKLSLSKMTFSHQMVRLFLAEQIYRAFSIIKKEAYHHE